MHMIRSSTGSSRRNVCTVAVALLCSRSLYSSSSNQGGGIGSASALRIAVVTGTTRTSGPPRPVLGNRVSKFIERSLRRRGHDSVTVIDPREIDLPLLDKPHFAYAKSRVPSTLASIHSILDAADAYVMVTPEYNHAPSPALLNVLNHFGSSTFGYKPSAIVSYSAGQWGGTRAAHAMRPFLSELGCLPVSAMVHVPRAGAVLDEGGVVVVAEEGKDGENYEAAKRWDGYVDRCLSQLEWWGEACRAQREKVDPYEASPAFARDPSQRDAPPSDASELD